MTNETKVIKCLRKQLKLDNSKLIKKGNNSYEIKNSYGDCFFLYWYDSIIFYNLIPVLGDRPPCRWRDIEQQKVESHIKHCFSICFQETTKNDEQ